MVVANQTLGCPELEEALEPILSVEPIPEIVIMAPVTATEGEHEWDYPPTDRHGPAPEVIAHALASARLQRQLDQLRRRGASADGEVSEHNPLTRVGEMLAAARYDEIIVCTLPTRLSRWLRMDFPKRLDRATEVPVRHIQGSAGPSL